MKEELLTFIRAHPRASFSEVEHFFELHHFEYQGSYCIEMREESNVMLWHGWSYEATQLFLELVREHLIDFHPASWIEIMLFGKVYSLPRAKNPAHNYKSLRWLPVVISAAGA